MSIEFFNDRPCDELCTSFHGPSLVFPQISKHYWDLQMFLKFTSRLRTMVVPSANAARSRIRLESDLLPGSFTVPDMLVTGWMVSCSTAAGAAAAA